MLLEHEGLNEATVGVLRMTTSTLQEGVVTRERVVDQGSRLLRGEEYKDFDVVVKLQKEVKKNDLKSQKQETSKEVASRAVSESGVMLCRHCHEG
jgi:aspartate/glutamate racemase